MGAAIHPALCASARKLALEVEFLERRIKDLERRARVEPATRQITVEPVPPEPPKPVELPKKRKRDDDRVQQAAKKFAW